MAQKNYFNQTLSHLEPFYAKKQGPVWFSRDINFSHSLKPFYVFSFAQVSISERRFYLILILNSNVPFLVKFKQMYSFQCSLIT